ncbi:MAG TPA: response regulator transcription factor [Gaiellaceae bacterium]|nr:response regulator transcription factor [Gaiellaceae bacterium]
MRLLIADDRLTIEGIRRALDGAEGIEVVAETYSGADVLPLLEQTRPDMLLLDIRMPGLDGFATLDKIRTRHPKTTVVVLSALNDPEQVHGALSRGAAGYVAKSVDPANLPAVLREAVAGNVHYALTAPVVRSRDERGLTEREHAILRAVARGLSNQAIARELWLSEQTVKFHLHNVYRKLALRNRTEAARYAYENGLAGGLAEEASAAR